ncbi:cytochrome c1 [Hydrocarboniphaga sp.]|uniref:cytochrome c1 n=1 Tax=Hydrocarboniphaga sp. TaxID=2033016 RepID=UPI003D0B0980
MRAHKLLLAIAGLLISDAAVAASGHALPYTYQPDTSNIASMQRGARDFMAYCSGCHSMKYLRYNRIGNDLQIPEELLKSSLMFTSTKVGDQIHSAMPAEASKVWFGQTPPDLTLETRARGASWVYSYLRTFYVDTTRPVGVNNLVLPGASMPHVLWELQGWQVKEAAHEGGEAAEHGEEHHGAPLKLVQAGTLSPDEYEKFVGDIVNFMSYAAEPGKSIRMGVGPKAMVYLLLLLVLCYLLKKEFWRDIKH